MTKVLFILSAVVILVASFFAYQNGREFAAVRLSVAEINATINKEKLTEKKVVAEVGQLVADVTRVQGELDVEGEKLKAQKNKLAQAESEATRVQEEQMDDGVWGNGRFRHCFEEARILPSSRSSCTRILPPVEVAQCHPVSTMRPP